MDEEESVPLDGEESALTDEGAYTIFCWHSIAGDKDKAALNPDPASWEEAMSRPDWKQWVEASKAERRNLINRKVFTVLTDSEVERLQQGGVTIHTTKNVLKTKINPQGNPTSTRRERHSEDLRK
jgi:hypothetical protein